VRVTTYSQPATAIRGSLFAWLVLVLTVFIGTTSLHTLVLHFVPQLGVLTASILWLLLYLLAFLGLMFSQGINWISWMVRYRILLVILLLGTVISISWSVDAKLSAERTVHLLGCSVIAIYLGFMVPLLTILRIAAGVFAVLMLGSVGAALGLPELGIVEYEGKLVWKGILNSKNSLGFWSAISVLLFITLSDSVRTGFMRLMCWSLAAVSFGVLVMSQSATSLLAMVVAGSLSLYLYLAFRFQLGFVRMLVMAVLFLGLIGLVFSNIDTAELLGRSGDLTGRGEVWRQTWKLIMQQPLTGYGYGALWFPNEDTLWIQQKLTDFTWIVYHAHNGFLQVASEIGLPLSVVALLMVVLQFIEIFYCQYERQQVGVLFVLAFVVAYLISNFSEARFLVNRELYWIFFVALPISMLRQITLVSGHPNDWIDDSHEESFASQRTKSTASDGELRNDLDHTGSFTVTGAHDPSKPWLKPAVSPAAATTGAADVDAGTDADTALDTALDTGTSLDESSEAMRSSFNRSTADTEKIAKPGNQVDHLYDDAIDLTINHTADIDVGEPDVVLAMDSIDADATLDELDEEDPHDEIMQARPEDFENLDEFDDDHYDRLDGDKH